MVGPDIAEHEGPDADENVDEHFHRGGGAEDPARLIGHALRRGLRQDQRFGDAAARDRRAFGFDGKSDPGARDQRLLPQERLRQERQDQYFDHREDDDERGDQHRYDRPGTDGGAGGDRRRHAANRNARRQRRRPFAVEAEPLAGDEIHHRPIDEVSLDDRGDAAQQQRGRKIEFAGGGHGEKAAEDHDRDLDVEFRPNCFLDRLGEARKHIGDDQPREQREDEAAFIGQAQRPADAELLQFGWRDRCETGVAADNPTGIGDPEHGGEGERELSHVRLQRDRRRAQHREQRHIGGEQGAGAAEGSVGLRGRAERLAEIAPHRGRDHPADQIDIGEHRERQNKNEKTDDDGEPVLADPRRGFARAPGRLRGRGRARGSRFDGRHDVLLRQRATAARPRPPSSRDSLSLNTSARGGIFYFASAHRYNIFLF